MSGGTLTSSDANTDDFPGVCAGTAAGGVTAFDGYAVGQQYFDTPPGLHIAYLAFFAFDTTLIAPVPTTAELHLTIGLAHADSAQDPSYGDVDFYVSFYDDDPAALSPADWLDTAALSGFGISGTATGFGVANGDPVVIPINTDALNPGGRTRLVMFSTRQQAGGDPNQGAGTADEYWTGIQSISLFVDDVEVDGPPVGASDCITVEVPDFLADGSTPDANGIVYTPSLVGGWWDSIPLTSATAEVQPRGETVTVAQELGREIALEITAHSPEAGVPLGPVLCFTAMETIKAAFRTVFVPSTFRVADPFADRTLLARRVGPIKQTILGDSAVVQSSIPLLAEDPRRFPT